ncbi:hypothetical protein Aph01nite_03280 [Acrocarpospora phusangensis]|uniref:Uncharacterized protein n=1 Tax=Acrocarpospora phusangensis TaxID=1070424 RepID=A0A919Q6T7_9ACTN|nr:hypothetical protein [Acrocarpospora phusangensis]GIH22018.1 hypothetical protein Aph01nite_03280 [Acrocarpospora phusangensis]
MLTPTSRDWEDWATGGEGHPPPGWGEKQDGEPDLPIVYSTADAADEMAQTVMLRYVELQRSMLELRLRPLDPQFEAFREALRGSWSKRTPLVDLACHGDSGFDLVVTFGDGRKAFIQAKGFLTADGARRSDRDAWRKALNVCRAAASSDKSGGRGRRKLPRWLADVLIELASRTLPIPFLIGIDKIRRSRTAVVPQGYDSEAPRIAPSFGELAVHYTHHASTR